MQKEIERNLNLRNEIRHRIVTHETISSDKKKTQEGLKYLLADRGEASSTGIVGGGGSGGGLGGGAGAGAGLAGLSASVSSSTHTSSTVVSPSPVAGRAASVSGEEPITDNTYTNTQPAQQQQPSQQQQQAPPTMNTLRPANFLTGFGGYELGSSNFITRGMSGTPRSFSSFRPEGEQPSISTRFFQRIATRFEQK